MSYDIAINKSWEAFLALAGAKDRGIHFLADEYAIDTVNRRIFSVSCNVPAKDYTAILILHYAAAALKGLPPLENTWFTFRELSGVEGYQEAFRQRVIERILKKYGNNPEGLLCVLERVKGSRAPQADVSVIIEAFEKIPVMIEIWKGDEELGPEANLLFDKSITSVFCTEDIVVLAERIAAFV